VDIVLVHHATCAHLNRVLLGRTVDEPLDLRGEGQARALAARLLSVRDLTIESSPRRRARHTAGIIAAVHDTVVRIAPDMDDVDFGSWSGRSFAALAADPHWMRWNQYRAVTRTPAGDSILQVQQLAMTHFRKLRQTLGDSTVAIVTHTEVIRAVVLLALQLPIEDYRRVDISAASLTTLNIDGTLLRLESVNQRAAA
jgi:broad specificity phosphatase PhoE